MDNDRASSFSRENIPEIWYEHSESAMRMSQDELEEVARKAVGLFLLAVTGRSNGVSQEEYRSKRDAAAPEVDYLLMRMFAGDRLSSPLGSYEESAESYGRRARDIAAPVADKYTGYQVTREDWSIS